MDIEAYCMKCRVKRPVQDPVAEYNAAGRPVTRGVCPECGTALYRMGETPAHANVPKPATPAQPKKTTAKTTKTAAPVSLETVSGPGEAVEAYCVKCRTKRTISEPRAEYTATGRAGTKGVCPECGTTLYRPGETVAHASLAKPSPEAAKAARKAASRARKAPLEATTRAPKATGKAASGKTSGAGSKPGRAAGGAQGGGHGHGGRLVIVESPAKARTISKFLGRGYNVRASIGHVRDLLKSQLSVDVEHDFEPKYRVPNEKKSVVKELTALAKGADQVFLATDPDREG